MTCIILFSSEEGLEGLEDSLPAFDVSKSMNLISIWYYVKKFLTMQPIEKILVTQRFHLKP